MPLISSNNSFGKVLLFAEYSSEGGTRTYAKQLVAFYSQHGYKVSLISANSRQDYEMANYCLDHNARLFSYQSLVGCNPKIPSTLLDHIRLRFELEQVLRANPAQIIVFSVGSAGLFLSKLLWNRSSIYILHCCVCSSRKGLRLFLSKLYQRIMLPSNTHFLTVSQCAMKQLKHLWAIPNPKISFIYNTVGYSYALPRQPATGISILSVGNLVHYKNPFIWIEVAKKIVCTFPHVKFTWLGSGPLLHECQHRVAALNLENSINFAGHVDDCDNYYVMADVFLHLSLLESLGMAVLDALRFGIPSVVANVGGLPETIEDNVSGFLVDPKDPTNVCESLSLLIKDKNRRLSMGKSALRRYSELFSPEIWCSQYAHLNNLIFRTDLTKEINFVN